MRAYYAASLYSTQPQHRDKLAGMCLILFAYQHHPRYPLIVAANRDEFFERPTRSAHFWEDSPDLLAGRDLQAGGTWMGMSRQGRFAAVTNFREPRSAPEDAKSRGLLCTEFLQSTVDLEDYLDILSEERDRFAGFNLLVGDFSDTSQPRLACFSNRAENGFHYLKPGVHGISNGLIDDPWPKVEGGKRALESQLDGSPAQLLNILLDSTTADPDQLPNTGIDKALEELYSARFIRMETYGTRCATVLQVANNGQVEWLEQVYGPGGEAGQRQVIEFTLQPG